MVFIELVFQSLVTGRPPIIFGKFIDCHIPSVEEEYIFEQGEVSLGCEHFFCNFHWNVTDSSVVGIWSCRFSIECLLPVAEATLAVNPPTYRSILELDERIRKFDVPIPTLPPGATQQPASTMQRFVREHYRELSTFTYQLLFRSVFLNSHTTPSQRFYSFTGGFLPRL